MSRRPPIAAPARRGAPQQYRCWSAGEVAGVCGVRRLGGAGPEGASAVPSRGGRVGVPRATAATRASPPRYPLPPLFPSALPRARHQPAACHVAAMKNWAPADDGRRRATRRPSPAGAADGWRLLPLRRAARPPRRPRVRSRAAATRRWGGGHDAAAGVDGVPQRLSAGTPRLLPLLCCAAVAGSAVVAPPRFLPPCRRPAAPVWVATAAAAAERLRATPGRSRRRALGGGDPAAACRAAPPRTWRSVDGAGGGVGGTHGAPAAAGRTGRDGGTAASRRVLPPRRGGLAGRQGGRP